LRLRSSPQRDTKTQESAKDVPQIAQMNADIIPFFVCAYPRNPPEKKLSKHTPEESRRKTQNGKGSQLQDHSPALAIERLFEPEMECALTGE
jgi:hypothetical protein